MPPQDPAQLRPIRPALAIRVGVTGARDIGDQPPARILEQIRFLLTQVKRQAETLAADPRIRAAYASDPDGTVPLLLRIVSPLAEGADRVVARAALELGYQLDVPMPFAQAAYEMDFTDPTPSRDPALNAASLADFRALLAHASHGARPGAPRMVALDGGRGDDEAASYGAVGRFVVRNCDVLIAVWNGLPGKGGGGTSDTVRFAARSGPPVWWVHAVEDRPPVWIDTLPELRRPHAHRAGRAAEELLQRYIDSVLLPPSPAPRAREGLIGAWFGRNQPPLPRYYAEQAPPGTSGIRRIWRIEKQVMALASYAGECLDFAAETIHRCGGGGSALARRVFRPFSAPRTAAEPVAPLVLEEAPALAISPGIAGLPGASAAAYWQRLYDPPDQLSSAYASRYRSSYTLITLAAALALLSAAAQHAWPGGALLLSLIELAGLVMLLAFVAMNHHYNWHERWISYRLLAELCRKQGALAMLGWALPVGETWRVARGEDGASQGGVAGGFKRDGWVGWYFHAALRAAPMPSGTLGGSALNATRDAIVFALVGGQLSYHNARRTRVLRESRGLHGWGELFLLLSAAFVLVKAMLVAFGVAESAVSWLETLIQLLVVPSAAFVALRIYAELELLAETDAAMVQMMRAARDRLDKLDGTELMLDEATPLPLVSQEVGAAVYQVAVDMMAENEGWVRLFNVKDVEAA